MSETTILSLTPANVLLGKLFSHFLLRINANEGILLTGQIDPHENRGLKGFTSKLFRNRQFPLAGNHN